MSPFGVDSIVGSLPKQEAYIVDSIFESGLLEFDQNVVFININDLENMFNLDLSSRFVELFLKNPRDVEKNRIDLQKIFKDELIYLWSDLNKSLFLLKIERNVMFIILSLIIIVLLIYLDWLY